ncbi:ATP-dependent DNA ligase [Bradyrhizobium sp. USDA 4486]
MAGFIAPQLATLKMKAPSGSQWIREVKYDGYRIQVRINGDDRRAHTRNGHNWVHKSPSLPAPSTSKERRSLTARWSLSTRGDLTSPSCRPTSREGIRIA